MTMKPNANGKERPFGRTYAARKRERGVSAGCILALLFLLIALALSAIFIHGVLRRMLDNVCYDDFGAGHHSPSGEETTTIHQVERESGEELPLSGAGQTEKTLEGAAANEPNDSPAASAGDLPQTVTTSPNGAADPVETRKESDNNGQPR